MNYERIYFLLSFFLSFFLFFVCFFFETGFLCVALEPVLSLALVDQAGLKLMEINQPASSSRVLRLKVCTTSARLRGYISAVSGIIP